MLRASLPIIYGMGMAILIVCAGILGFVNASNIALWFVALFGGVGGLTLLDIIMSELGDSDVFEPRRTYTTTSHRIVHIERPRRPFSDDDEFD